MININLLPVELRPVKKKKTIKKVETAKQAVSARSQFPIKIAAVGGAALFLVLTLFFYFSYLGLQKKQVRVNQEFAGLQPSVQSVRALEQEVTTLLQPEKDFLNTNILSKAAITSILQAMSESLPAGVWLTFFSIDNAGKDRSFQLQGVALSSQDKTNIQQIEEYLQSLKKILPNAQFVYSTGKQVSDKVPATAFTANFQWRAD